MRYIVELIFIVILLFSIWIGYKKGFVMTVGSILIIIISLFVGDLLSNTFAHEAVPVVRPFLAGYMEGNEGTIGEALDEILGGSASVLSADDAMELHPELKSELCEQSFLKMGVYSSAAKEMAENALKRSEQDTPISTVIVDEMCDTATYYLGFILFFAITLILLIVLGNLTNLSFKIPNADKLNTLGGAAAGLVVGFLFCAFAAWILKFTGRLLPEEDLWGIFSPLFVKINLFSAFLSI